MAVFLQPIYTQTVGAGGTGGVTFNNIPQTFTDLMIVGSSRAAFAVESIAGALRFNGDTANNYSDTAISNASSSRNSNNSFMYAWYSVGSTGTANTFGNGMAYIPNYTSSNFKQVIGDYVPEGNISSFTTGLGLLAGLWRNTAAITSITCFPGGGSTFTQYTTFSLYGILRSGV